MGNEENNSLINLGNLSKPATVLIEKISNATGAIFAPWQIKRVAKAEAEATVIRARGEAEADIIHTQAEMRISEIQKRGLKRVIHQAGIEQQNIEQIIAKTIKLLNEDANPKAIKNEFLVNLFDKCKLVSDEEMQEIWAKILAGEANRPGSYSKRTINALNSFSKGDAYSFTRLCGYVVQTIGGFRPLIFDIKDDIYRYNNISFETLSHLNTIGLIKFYNIGEFQIPGFGFEKISISYNKIPIEMTWPRCFQKGFPVGSVSFTSVGTELVSICDSQPVDGFIDYIKQTLRKKSSNTIEFQ